MTLQTLSAQIDDELRSLYREIIPKFSGELKVKLQRALDQGQDFIELDPQQFREFREHPANPFSGWNNIDASKLSGVIRLQFETQPVRSRRPTDYERQSSRQLAELEPVCAAVAESTVKLIDGKKQLCYGIVVSNDGYIVTKHSEVKDTEKLFCRLHDGNVYQAKMINADLANDLALIKIEADNLRPIVWGSSEPSLGSFLVSPDNTGIPFAMGVYSHVPRSLVGRDQAFIGIKPQSTESGLLVVQVSKDQPADIAGLKVGDIILTIDRETIDSVTGLVNAVRARRPGDVVIVEFSRNGVTGEIAVTLAGRDIGNETADRLKMMNKFGAIPSNRYNDFPLVFQHDTPLLPEQCGGPLVDLEGNVIGFNIARAGRTDSYAIPATLMPALVTKLAVPTLASRTDQSETK
ncbi:MAG TPA: PDZ domain-containing protein [Pirellulaceae bacterium]|nr:PDZ domain-containing protein [Pirellulaceae bacterium]